ncbi:MAG: hypothetical protein ACTSX8_04625 [Alphaproteobacteria bacterium]
MSRNASLDKTVGFGWVGRWDDGTIGWILPAVLTGHVGNINTPPHNSYAGPDVRLVKCRITIEVIKDKRGRPITRKASTLGISKGND